MFTIRVLAVDDEPGMRSGIERILLGFSIKVPDIEDEVSFQVDLAENAEEALIKIQTQLPDLLLLDYKMPGMSGLELLEKLESVKNKDEMLVIMITAYASLDTAVSAIKSGAFDFLSKPFTPKELKDKVTKATQSQILSKQVRKLNEERKQVRFQFISVLGHELKSPLSAMEGYLNMIKSRTLGGELVSYDSMIDRCLVRSEQMNKLIMDILELTKIESGRRRRIFVPLRLIDEVQMSVESAMPDAQRRNISLNIDCAPDLTACFDKDEISMLLNNLVTNAVKYNRDGGRVDIRISRDDQFVTFQVQDTGIGLTPAESARLFGEFVRIKNKKTSGILGSGIGLSTVKRIAELNGGTASVDSTPDVGSTFTVRLVENEPTPPDNQ
jgi:signal transduction histidine kinase